MTEVVEFESAHGPILVEVEGKEPSGVRRTTKGAKPIVEATKSFDQAVDGIVPAAKDLLERLQALKPDSAELEFGIKLSGELGGIFAKASGEGHIKVTLTWQSAASAAAGG